MTLEPLFDFEKGEFVFSPGGEVLLVTGIEGLKNQIRKILHTASDRYRIYAGYGYGNGLEALLIGKVLPKGYLTAEIERCATDALLTLDEVETVNDFSVSHTGSLLSVSFRLGTIYGSLDEEEVLYIG